MFTTLALAAILVTSPAQCPASAPWAIPSGTEVAPYLCVASDPGEQLPNFDKPPAPKLPVHHAPKHRAHHTTHHHHAHHHAHHAKGRHAR